MNELVKSQLRSWLPGDAPDNGLERAAGCLPCRSRHDPNYDGLNFSRGLLDPVNAIIKLVGRTYWAPAGVPIGGHYETPDRGADQRNLQRVRDEKRARAVDQLHELEGRER